MDDSDAAGKGSQALDASGLIQGKRTYGPNNLPPGAVPVEEEVLARYVQPGAVHVPHGVPPIGVIGLPAGWVVAELDNDAEELRVLPFRFPWYSRAYALRCDDRLMAVLRNVMPMELMTGQQVVVQFNESRDWTAVFGTVTKLALGWLEIRSPNEDMHQLSNEEIHFVGKVMHWWDSAQVEALKCTEVKCEP